MGKPRKPSKGAGTYRAGQGTGPQVAASIVQAQKAGTKKAEITGEELVKLEHNDWREHQIEWRKLADSYECGDRYRNATYGRDRCGLPCRNLFRHRKEYPDAQMNPQIYQGWAGFSGGFGMGLGGIGIGPLPGQLGADQAATAQDDDYELRRARTPVPPFVREVCDTHLGKIYDKEVERDGPDELKEWWEDVDGRGTCIDDYMQETIAPLLLTLGTLDICFDHPRVPPGVTLETRADEIANGMDACIASYIMPENMVWWRIDLAGRFTECLVREYTDPADRDDLDENGEPIDPDGESDVSLEWRKTYSRWRHWTSTESVLYSYDGKEVKERIPHKFGRPPIVRLVAKKKHRTQNVGLSLYAPTAEYQREYYNRDSELILSDILQAHPHLSGPEQYCKAGNTVEVGPGNILPRPKDTETGRYGEWVYVSPSKDPADSIRRNKMDILDAVHRLNGLTKPPGATGTGRDAGTVGQSGISKQLDANVGNKILRNIAMSLARAERFMCEYVMLVKTGKPPTPAAKAAIKIGYTTKYELNSADEIISATGLMQNVMNMAGNAPNLERELLQATYRQLLPGMSDEAYKEMDLDIETLMETKSTIKAQVHEVQTDILSGSNALTGQGSEEQRGGEDSSGQSAATSLSGVSALVK